MTPLSWKPSYRPIGFSFTNEDHATVERALDVRPGDRVLCIASAGDTPLNLLRFGPSLVEAVDSEFSQTCLASLKATALGRLESSDFLRFLGVTSAPAAALADYARLRGELPAEVRAFWDRHQFLIRRGLQWQGGLQRQVRLACKLLRPLLGVQGWRPLRRAVTADDSLSFFASATKRLLVQVAFGICFGKYGYRRFCPQSGLDHLPNGLSPQKFSLNKARNMFSRPDFSHNPYLFPLLFGTYPCLETAPPYLQAGCHPDIRKHLGRLVIVNADVREHAAGLPDCSLNCVALSNVVDWLNRDAAELLFREIVRAAAQDARILVCSRGAWYGTVPGTREDADLSADLARLDRVGYFSTIRVLRVSK